MLLFGLGMRFESLQFLFGSFGQLGHSALHLDDLFGVPLLVFGVEGDPLNHILLVAWFAFQAFLYLILQATMLGFVLCIQTVSVVDVIPKEMFLVDMVVEVLIVLLQLC